MVSGGVGWGGGLAPRWGFLPNGQRITVYAHRWAPSQPTAQAAPAPTTHLVEADLAVGLAQAGQGLVSGIKEAVVAGGGGCCRRRRRAWLLPCCHMPNGQQNLQMVSRVRVGALLAKEADK